MHVEYGREMKCRYATMTKWKWLWLKCIHYIFNWNVNSLEDELGLKTERLKGRNRVTLFGRILNDENRKVQKI